MGRRAALGRAVLAVCVLVGAASLAVVLVTTPGGAATSRDPGAPTAPWALVLLPAIAGIALALVLPWRPPPQPAVVGEPRRLRASTNGLLAIAVLFPVAVGALGLGSSGWYHAAKALLLVLAAGVLVAAVRGVRIERSADGWRWWAPLIVLAVWFALSQLAPWVPRADLGGVDPVFLAVAATLTALTAGVGEELFYRRWLQTRLEAALGVWPGIALASLAFALMHLGSHGTGDLVGDVARVVVAQGSFGLLCGVLWWRYRNLTDIIAIHILSNGWPVIAHLAG